MVHHIWRKYIVIIDSACAYGNFITSHTQTSYIECMAIKCESGSCHYEQGACYKSIFHAEYSQLASIQCGGDHYDCYATKFYVNGTG